jgi:hypothetical protein
MQKKTSSHQTFTSFSLTHTHCHCQKSISKVGHTFFFRRFRNGLVCRKLKMKMLLLSLRDVTFNGVRRTCRRRVKSHQNFLTAAIFLLVYQQLGRELLRKNEARIQVTARIPNPSHNTHNTRKWTHAKCQRRAHDGA